MGNGKESRGRADVYRRITDKIVADLEQGVRLWMRLWDEATERGYIPPDSKTPTPRHLKARLEGVTIVTNSAKWRRN